MIDHTTITKTHDAALILQYCTWPMQGTKATLRIGLTLFIWKIDLTSKQRKSLSLALAEFSEKGFTLYIW